MAKACHQLPLELPGVVCANNILYEHAPLYPPWDWGCPHLKHGHRAVCSVVIISDLLDVLEVEAGFEAVQSWAAEQSSASGM